MTDPWVTPCAKCGSRNFDLRADRHRNGDVRLKRFCVPCATAAAKRRRALDRERHRKNERERKRRERDRKRRAREVER